MLLVIYLLGDLVGQGGKRGSKCELELLNPIPPPLSSGLLEVMRKFLNLEGILCLALGSILSA